VRDHQQYRSAEFILPCCLLQNPAAAAALTYCFSFFDQPDCDSFTSALQAMLDRQRQQQQQQQQQQHRDALALHTTSGPAGQQQRDIAGQETITGASHAGTTGTTTPVPQGLQKAPSNQLEGQAEAKAAVKVCWASLSTCSLPAAAAGHARGVLLQPTEPCWAAVSSPAHPCVIV